MSDTTDNKTDAMMYGSLPSSANYEREIIVELRKEVERLGHVLRASLSVALENQSEVFRRRAEDDAIRAEFGGKRDGRPTIECVREAFAAKWSTEDTLFQATLDMKTEELRAEVARLAAENERLRTALEWYGEQARFCRLIHSEGDAGRKALNDDGGLRARTALQNKSD